MLRNFALCAVFLAARGLPPGAYSFTVPSQRLVVAKQRSWLFTQHRGHPQGVAHVRKNIPSSEGATASRSRRDQAQRRHGGVHDAGVVIDEMTGVDGIATAAAETASGEVQPQETAQATTKTFVACAVLACLFVFASWPLREVAPCYALDAAAVAPSQQQQQTRLLVPPRPPQRDRPPAPEIPPGRITIAQWVGKNIGSRLPRIDVQTAAETVAKIRVNSGPAPTAEELRRMTGDAAKREWDGSFAGVLAGRGGNKEATTTVGGRGGDTAELPASRSKAEATTEEPSVPPPQLTRQQQIDALKVELLQLQTASPEATTSQPASEASPPERKTPNKLPPLSRITVGRPSPLKMGMGFFPRTESVPAQARATREQPPPRKEKKTATRRVASLAVDLKEELRAESEKAAERASQRAAREKNTSPRVAGVQGTSVGGIELVPPAPLYSPEKVATDSTSRAPLFTVPTGGSGAGAGGGDLSSEPVGLGGGTATARTLLEGVGSGRLPEPLDVAEQVKNFAQKGAQASDDGVAAVLEQGRASVDRLQAEASRISAGVGESARPIADNLATGVAKLPEAGRATSDRLSEFSGSVAEKLSDSAKDATTSVADLGATTVGRLSGALGRGAGKVLPSVGEAGMAVSDGVSAITKHAADGLPVIGKAGRVVSDGVSAITKNAADGLPAVQDQASIISSQVLDTSTRAASQATDIVSAGAGKFSGRLSNLVGRGPEFAGRAKKALNGLTSGAAGFTDDAIAATKRLVSAVRRVSGRSSSGGEAYDAIYTVAAGAVAVAGAAAVARGIGVGAAAKGAGAGNSGSAGAGATHDEERVLQPIGVREETGASSEGGERFGAEAVSATGTLWDIIRESGTGAGDAVREVSEEDLLARAAIVGGQLRETTEGLEVLKEEVMSLRESIRESDLDDKALTERLASTLEGNVAD